MSSPVVDSEIRERLTDIFFKAAGGISDMAKDEVEQVMRLLKTEYKNGFSHGQDSLLRSGQSVPALFTEEEVKQLLQEQTEKWEKQIRLQMFNEIVGSEKCKMRTGSLRKGGVDTFEIEKKELRRIAHLSSKEAKEVA